MGQESCSRGDARGIQSPPRPAGGLGARLSSRLAAFHGLAPSHSAAAPGWLLSTKRTSKHTPDGSHVSGSHL